MGNDSQDRQPDAVRGKEVVPITLRRPPEYEPPSSAIRSINAYLRFCAGTSLEILSHCNQTEYVRQAILGAFVSITAVIGFLTSGYSIWSVTNSPVAAVIGGSLWSSLIFFIDRLLVSSTSICKSRNGTYRPAFILLLPRVALAAIIGCTIAVPFELLIFNREIVTEIGKEERTTIIVMTDKKAEIEQTMRANLCDKQFSREVTLGSEVSSLERQVDRSIHGGDNSGRVACGPICTGLLKKLKQEEEQLRDLSERKLVCLKSGLADTEILPDQLALMKKEQKDIDAAEAERSRMMEHPSLLRQLRVLLRLEKDAEMRKAIDSIVLLFVTFDIVPVTLKLLSGVGQYDVLAYEEKQITIAEVRRREIERDSHSQFQVQTQELLAETRKEESRRFKEMHAALLSQLTSLFDSAARTQIDQERSSFDVRPEVQQFARRGKDLVGRIFRFSEHQEKEAAETAEPAITEIRAREAVSPAGEKDAKPALSAAESAESGRNGGDRNPGIAWVSQLGKRMSETFSEQVLETFKKLLGLMFDGAPLFVLTSLASLSAAMAGAVQRSPSLLGVILVICTMTWVLMRRFRRRPIALAT